MKSLETIQKTFKVFGTLAKVAQVLCIVGASICAVTALCAVTWFNGGHVFSIFGQPIDDFFGEDKLRMYVKLLALTFTLTADAVLFGFSHSYFKSEQTDGTPFTEKGAVKIRRLGIRCIYIPIIAAAVSAAIAKWQGVTGVLEGSNLPQLIIGVMLILASLVFSYGAELESKNKPMSGFSEEKDAQAAE